MKNYSVRFPFLFRYVLVFFLVFAVPVVAQEGVEDSFYIDETSQIKDTLGNLVPLDRFMQLMDTGNWIVNPVRDKNGKISFLRLRKATAEEKQMLEIDLEISDKIGTSAPAFDMINLEGIRLNNQNTKGKVVVLQFWFANCIPCIQEIPDLNAVYRRYQEDTDVVFAAITFENTKDATIFKTKHAFAYPIVANAKATCQAFGVLTYPTHIILDKRGKILEYQTGAIYAATLIDRIETAKKKEVSSVRK